MKFPTLFIFIFLSTCFLKVQSQTLPSKKTISGIIKEAESGELLPATIIYIPSLKVSTISNNFGFYSLTFLSNDSIEVSFSLVGYKTTIVKLPANNYKNLDIFLQPDIELEEITITDQKGILESPQMSQIKLSSATINTVPALLGERDILKVIQLMPGVQKGSEGSNGLYVRGGGPDQNLIILDDAPIYNPNHLFGFLSVFSGDAIKSVELTKGGFPARYGGRLSSVLDLQMKDGNKEKMHGEASVGIISSKLTLEGPLKKNKASFLVSGRRTYLDFLTSPFLNDDRKASYFFYDLNGKVNYEINKKNKLFFSAFLGQDNFKAKYTEFYYKVYPKAMKLNWGNIASTLKWNHIFNDKLFSNFSFVYSKYHINSSDEIVGGLNQKIIFKSYIRDLSTKIDFDFYPSSKYSLKFGTQVIFHNLNPVTSFIPHPDSALGNHSSSYNGMETGTYLENKFKISSRLFVNMGLRGSSYTISKKSYFNLEPRASVSFKITENSAIKSSYALMNQYINLLTFSTLGVPADLWVPTTPKVAPQVSEQVALGFVKELFHNKAELTIESYYKKIRNNISYKPGADYLSPRENSRNWEDKVTQGKGWAYGMEFLLNKKKGRFTGWIGYTLSWAILQFDSINNGIRFYGKYDRRHDLSIVGIYKPTEKINISVSWILASGNPINLPIGFYQFPGYNTDFIGQYKLLYSERDEVRTPSIHRLDVGVQFIKKLKWGGERRWEVSVYNAYNRKNSFYYFITTKKVSNPANGYSYLHQLKQVNLFPILPSVSYKLKF